MRKALTAAMALALVAGSTAAATAAPAPEPAHHHKPHSDERSHDLELKRRALRQQALTEVLTGEATAERRGGSVVAKVGRSRGKDQYVELERERTGRIFVVLAEFGDERHPDYPDRDTDPETPGPQRFDGPLHNRIPAPDRFVDNSTIWQPDYDREHFQDLYFSRDRGANSVANYFDKQSSGRYTVEGHVTDWVKVRYNEARYGRSNGYPCDFVYCANTAELVADATAQWVADQRAAGQSAEQVTAALREFDVWDRYDHDGDGDFNEPDGYIDHFQIVHAGSDQAVGDATQGEDAIWSHRWYAFPNNTSGPAGNRLGGAQIADTGLWVGDYTVQPENGGIAVFTHEFAHDLGLPDHYATEGGANGVHGWSLMSDPYMSAPGEALGERSQDLSAWDKLQLGWLKYELAAAGDERVFELGPHEYNSAKTQGLVVTLPDVTKQIDHGFPFAGERMWWSDTGDNLDNTLTAPLDLREKSAAALTLKARYDIEADWDHLYFEAANEDGTWTKLDGTANGAAFQRDPDGAPAISSSSNGQWVDVTVPLDAYAGRATQLRIAYRTDGATAPPGFFADAITVTADGAPLLTDGAEAGSPWTAQGFRVTTGKETKAYPQFYLASNRTYEAYGKYLKTGPYWFSFEDRPNLAEHFPYQDGLLVSLWNTSHTDNNTGVHPGEGLILPVDANPAPRHDPDGKQWASQLSGYDATFSVQRSDSFTLTHKGKPTTIRGLEARPVFDDTEKYWYAEQPRAGVKLPAAGVGLRVLRQSGTSMTVKLFKTR